MGEVPGSQTPHGELGPTDSRLRLTTPLSSPEGIFHCCLRHHPPHPPLPGEEPFSRGWEPRRLHRAGTGALLLCKYLGCPSCGPRGPGSSHRLQKQEHSRGRTRCQKRTQPHQAPLAQSCPASGRAQRPRTGLNSNISVPDPSPTSWSQQTRMKKTIQDCTCPSGQAGHGRRLRNHW